LKVGFRNVRLDALVEQRDHLKICINILENARRSDQESMSLLARQLAELERAIAEQKKNGDRV
jgi:hypothetical protein